MNEILVPTTDVNSETIQIVKWYVEDSAQVTEGDLLAEIETSKSVIDIHAPASGILEVLAQRGEVVPLSEAIGRIFSDAAEKQAFGKKSTTEPSTQPSVRATAKALELAKKYGVDLSDLGDDGKLITAKAMEAHVAAKDKKGEPTKKPAATLHRVLPRTSETRNARRVVLLGAGGAATQVIDILLHDPQLTPVALASEVEEDWGQEVCQVPVVGGIDTVHELFKAKEIESAIIAITDVAARARLFDVLNEMEIPLENAIHPTARIGADVTLGTGNIICAFCHFGYGTVVGNNNFISAYNSFDHHNVLGSHISTGPGCIMSGTVTLKDRVRLATGIFAEPKIVLGEDALVASGAVLTRSVPAGHTVKVRGGNLTFVDRASNEIA